MCGSGATRILRRSRAHGGRDTMARGHAGRTGLPVDNDEGWGAAPLWRGGRSLCAPAGPGPRARRRARADPRIGRGVRRAADGRVRHGSVRRGRRGSAAADRAVPGAQQPLRGGGLDRLRPGPAAGAVDAAAGVRRHGSLVALQHIALVVGDSVAVAAGAGGLPDRGLGAIPLSSAGSTTGPGACSSSGRPRGRNGLFGPERGQGCGMRSCRVRVPLAARSIRSR